ncbi:mechanosensitive ion channel family protein [Chloroflexota bacterium]
MDISYFLRVILPVIITIVVAILVERILSGVISRYGKKKGLSKSHSHMMRIIIRWAILVILIIVVASIFGVGIGNLWATFAGMLAMVIIGFFAMWSVLSNIFATLIILIARPFVIGDKVTILPENISGEAFDINIMYSKLKIDEGNVITVPNITFLTKFISISSSNK